MRRYRRSAGMPVRSCQYFCGCGSSYICGFNYAQDPRSYDNCRDVEEGGICRMLRHACRRLLRVYPLAAYELTMCPRYACKGEKPAEVRQGHFAKYMAPGHGVRKIYSSRVCAIKRAIKKRRVRGDIRVDSDKACLKRQVMHNVHKMWITSLLFGIHLHGSRRIWRINANALIISGKSA